MSKGNEYMLTPDERQDWYDYVVRPLFLDGKEKSDRPTFVLLTGQPAAGKTTAAAKYSQLLSAEPVKFGGDDIRILLPYADKLLHENPIEYPFITKEDMSWARRKLVTDTLAGGYNLQIDSILSNPADWKMETLLQAREAGYRVECIALGVHRYLSEVSMFIRREEQIKSCGVGFPVTMGPHDKAYDLLPEIVARMYTEGVADKVSIYNRQFDKYYDTSEVENPSGQAIMGAIIKSREDYLNVDALKYIQASWKNVYENMIARQAPETQLKEVLAYYSAFRKNSGIYMVDGNSGLQDMFLLLRQRKNGGRM